MSRRAFAPILLLASAACTSAAPSAPAAQPSEPPPAPAPAPARAPGKIVVERTSKTGAKFRYVFEREAAPVKTTLRSVIVLTGSPTMSDIHSAAEQPITLAVAVGDDGVVLERERDGTWARTRSDLHERLNAWCGRKIVGAHGTITGDRGAEPTDTTNDLAACHSRFAVGSAGTIVQRSKGPSPRWTTVQSPTKADLRAMWEGGTNCARAPGDPPPLATLHAFGQGGAIVRCRFAECWPDARPTTCEDVPSPTSADLNAFGFLKRPFVVGARGTILVADPTDGRWEAASTGLDADLRAVAVGYDLGVDANGGAVMPEPIVAGDRCTAAFVRGLDGSAPIGVDRIPLGCDADLFGASAFGLHVFLVGAGGTIWHGSVEGLTVPQMKVEPLAAERELRR